MVAFVMLRLRKVSVWAFGLLAVGLAAAALPATAAAATPTALDVPNNGAAPDVAYDPVTQNTFIAWTDPQSTANGAIDLCVLLKNTSACEGGGPVALTVTTHENPAITGDNTISLGGLTILPNGDVVVIATPVSNSSIAFESPGDGSAFLTSGQGLQNGGSFISPVSLFYTGGNVVALSNTDVGLLNDYGNYFSDSPFAGVAGEPYPATLPHSNTNPPPATEPTSTVYPRKALSTNGPEIAAEPAPPPAAAGTDIVVGVGDNFAGPNTQLSDCVNGDDVGTGYGLDVGLVGASSSSTYLNHQDSNGDSIPAYTGLACNAENPVVASPEGGTQGIGVLENEGNGLDGGTTYSLDYRPFVATASGGSFGAASLVSKLTDAAGDIDVVDDSTDGVYALWSGGGNLNANYSADGGAVWGPPVVIPLPSNIPYFGDPVITAVGGGEFMLSFDASTGSGKQTFVETFSYQALEQQPTTITTTQASGATTGTDITIPAGTVGESDRATIAGTNASLANGTVDFALYDNSSCSGTPVFSGAGAATAGVASIADDSATGLAEGKYYWTVAYTGDTYNQASTSTCGSEVLTIGAAATTSGSGTTTGSTVTLTISCPAACTVTITLEAPSGSGASAASAANKKKTRKPVKLGTGKLTLKKKGKGSLVVKLNGKGKSLVRKDHDKLKATLLLSTKTAHGTFKSTGSLKIHKGKAKRK
jgi:hypothetical protein